MSDQKSLFNDAFIDVALEGMETTARNLLKLNKDPSSRANRLARTTLVIISEYRAEKAADEKKQA